MVKSTRVGRHVRKMSMKEAFAVAKYKRGKQTITCRQCPKWKTGFCSIQGKFMLAVNQACNYGKTLIRAKRQSEKWRKK